MNAGKVFLDTNVIVYAYDSSARHKHELAKEIMIDLWDSGLGLLSTQVLQEFYVTVTRKIPKPLTGDEAKRIIKDLLFWNVVVNDGEAVLEAIDIQAKHKYSFWDALIVQSAIQGGAELLLSENLESERKISGVEIKNPFI